MEVEKRTKKRVIREEVVEEEEEEDESERVKKFREEESGSGVPTEEEVEEFFAILRRMKVAVKYFDDKGKGGKEWREALETAEFTVEHRQDLAAGEVDDDKTKKKDFDLNAVAPEDAGSGGA